MSDQEILARIKQLVEDERELRAKAVAGDIDHVAERQQLAQLEVMLDQAWDLLRHRRALAEFDEPVDDALPNSPRQVESYWQ
ncbi:DUF2630 family protein [Nocardia camponoti]|uniref:DUF2630 family protein n=1 Tax=Nocardia camponoti TaxID=1616106 RepID=A0A917QGK2_9NOCA|nr:DUF2630 family protein [Nocardia camponoti]GGK49560.1 hypothetical protein GCM10011591_21240 [Nocardia camponoti]